MEKKFYIGDGVYGEFNKDGLVLRANSPTEPTDTIYLGPEEMSSLVKNIEMLVEQDTNAIKADLLKTFGMMEI